MFSTIQTMNLTDVSLSSYTVWRVSHFFSSYNTRLLFQHGRLDWRLLNITLTIWAKLILFLSITHIENNKT